MEYDPEKKMEPCDPRIYLAAERTFLAWIRTGIALMGFGFIATRFGLYMRDEALQGTLIPRHGGVSIPVGLTLLSMGVVLVLGAALRFQRQITALDRGQFRHAFNPWFALSVAGILAAIGTLVAIFFASL